MLESTRNDLSKSISEATMQSLTRRISTLKKDLETL
jgi:hypothetical protein